MATITTASGRVSERAKPARRKTAARAKPVNKKSEVRNTKSESEPPAMGWTCNSCQQYHAGAAIPTACSNCGRPEFSEVAQPIGAPHGAEMLVPVADIVPSPYQPRTEFDGDEIRKLADSIAKHGLVQRPVVRLVDGVPELVAGERRLRAVKLLGWEQVKVEVRELDDVAACEIVIVENFDRQDLSPFDEAAGFQGWMTLTGRTQTECAERFKLTQGQISNRVRLLKLNSQWRGEVLAGRVTIKQARALCAYLDDLPAFESAAWREWQSMIKGIELPMQEEDFSHDLIREAINAITRPIGGKGNWNHTLGKHVPNFRPKQADREALGIVKVTKPVFFGKPKEEEVATNIKLWDELQKAHTEQLIAKKKSQPAPETQTSNLKPQTSKLTAAEKKAKAQAEAERKKKAEAVLAKRAEEWRTNWLRRLLHARLQAEAWTMMIARRLALHLICDTNFDRQRLHLASAAAKAIKARGGKVRKSGYCGHDLLGSTCDLMLQEQDLEDVLLDVFSETLLDGDSGEPSAALSPTVIEQLAEFCHFDLAEQWKLLWKQWHNRHREGEFLGELFDAMNKEQLAEYAALAKVAKGGLTGKKEAMIESIRKHTGHSPGSMTPPLPKQIKPLKA